ncbi:MAG: hypothetical protein CVT80_14860 [Alphaproteobacteria bacterium HGW-Alphaproteobacteria-2]|nr:MAG: hypothetical protein CVT80_14860 [Alphaproteobacteria bacterium HGW-Alphaproteobacteria-2]
MATPAPPEGETVMTRFRPDRAAYVRAHGWMAALAMALGMGALWVLGNPHVWTGAVGGLAAVALRGVYMASEELAAHWDLTENRLLGPGGRRVALAGIAQVNVLGSAVQLVTKTGDKHLIKHQADAEAARRSIEAARGASR